MDAMIFGSPLSDWFKGGALVLAITTCVQMGVSFGLIKFVGLQSPPIRRAFLTAASAYAICVVLLVFGGINEYAIWAPLASLPAVPVNYFYWKSTFIKAWYDDPALIPEGLSISNQDWRVGIYVLVAVIVVAFMKKAPLILGLQQTTGN